jgi:hypothetical protein
VRRVKPRGRKARSPHPADIAVKAELDIGPLAPLRVSHALENTGGFAEQGLVDLFGGTVRFATKSG